MQWSREAGTESMRTADLVLSRRTRQNHALEHATVSILAREIPGLAVSARSNSRGFVIFADLDDELVRRASCEALERLRAGEVNLAIHPNCGTNLAVGISLVMLGSLVALTSLRRSTRVASAVGSTAAGVVAARPLGQVVQRHITTLADMRGMQVSGVRSKRLWRRRVVEVLTGDTPGMAA